MPSTAAFFHRLYATDMPTKRDHFFTCHKIWWSLIPNQGTKYIDFFFFEIWFLLLFCPCILLENVFTNSFYVSLDSDSTPRLWRVQSNFKWSEEIGNCKKRWLWGDWTSSPCPHGPFWVTIPKSETRQLFLFGDFCNVSNLVTATVRQHELFGYLSGWP